jgi:hypothetical protein
LLEVPLFLGERAAHSDVCTLHEARKYARKPILRTF